MRAKHLFILTLVLSFAAAAALSAAPRYKERRSTKDLERVEVKGKVERIEGRKATLRTERGSHVTVHLGPQWYWRERDYRLEKGADVEVHGYGEIGDDEGGYVYPYEMEGEGFSYDFADENGYPRWAPDDEYYDGWYPSIGFYDDYYYCPPPPPPPPRYNWHEYRHHYGPRYGYVWHPRGGWRWRQCRPHFGVHFGFWWP